MTSIPNNHPVRTGVPRRYLGGNDFVMIHLDLVDALGGSWEAAGLLNRIHFRSGDDGWTVTKAQMQADIRLSERKLDRAIKELREAGFVGWERAAWNNATLRWWIIFDDDPAVPPEKDETSRTEKDETSPPENHETSRSEEDETSFSLSSKNTKNPPTPLDSFERFWQMYPKKEGRVAAERRWKDAVKHNVSPAFIIEGLRASLPSMRWRIYQGESQYIKSPAAWLDGGHWTDRPPRLTREQRQLMEGYV